MPAAASFSDKASTVSAKLALLIEGISTATKPVFCVRSVAAVLSSRAGLSWADQVAGDMERHYSPGRTWDTLARTLMPLLTLGQVLDVASGDGALAELLAPRAAALSPSRRWFLTPPQRAQTPPHIHAAKKSRFLRAQSSARLLAPRLARLRPLA